MSNNVIIKVFERARPPRVYRQENVFTDVGRNVVRNIMLGDDQDLLGVPVPALGPNGLSPNAMAIGTGTTTETRFDTELETEVFRKSIHRRHTLVSAGVYTVQYQTRFLAGEGDGSTITEAGLFNSVTDDADDMLARLKFTGIVKTAGNVIWIQWGIDIAT